MSEPLATRYTTTAEGTYLAYQVSGTGPMDLVIPVTGSAAVELIWDEPVFSEFVSRLASLFRLITFDPRGFGSSGRLDPHSIPAVQTWKDDIASVMDATGSERAAFLTWGEAAGATMFFAATHPERTTGLVLINAYARYTRSDATPWGLPAEHVPTYVGAIKDLWGSGRCFEMVAPSLVPTDDAAARWGRVERLTATPDVLEAATRAVFDSDVSRVLPTIQAPTLVVSRRGDRHVRHEHGGHVASLIPDAKLVELPGDDHIPYAGDVVELLDEVETFLTGVRPKPLLDRVLATVLFTDIVGSTERLAAVGDRRWRGVLDEHHAVIRRNLERFHGAEVNTTGDGFLATFDGPARALYCACAIRDEVRTLGIEIRAGLHTGEVERHGADLAGLAVHIGSRVAAAAAAGEVLVSRTVKDLVTGSGIVFDDRGERALKGVPGTWQLYAVRG
ncbi:MAG: adenylate/guanylate cyclase domain-containing protein [Acidimicrobiales bacterium]